MNVAVKPLTDSDRAWVQGVVRHWGADFVVTRGRKVYPAELDGFIAESETGERVGLITFEIHNDQCEIVTLDAFSRFTGVGTALIKAAASVARHAGCRRMWLITTNDNIDAFRFYQRRGFTIAAVHCDAIAESRRMKPSISQIGQYGIPIRDEVEFEKML